MKESVKFLNEMNSANSKYKKALINNNNAEFLSLLEQNLEEKMLFTAALNYFESIALAIESDLADENYLFNIFSTIFTKYIKILKSYIDYRQETSPKIFKNYENIALKWANHSEKLI